MTEKKFNTYLTYLMLLYVDSPRLINIEKSNYVKITDESILGRDYITIERELDGSKLSIHLRKRRK